MSSKESPNILSKLPNLLSSIRFWGITLSAASLVIAHPERFYDIVSGWFGTITAIGTVDKVTGHGSVK